MDIEVSKSNLASNQKWFEAFFVKIFFCPHKHVLIRRNSLMKTAVKNPVAKAVLQKILIKAIHPQKILFNLRMV
jgi:hypothetical protein